MPTQAKPLRVGGLCYGYGGIELALARIYPTTLAWYSEIDPGARKIAAHHHPHAPNIGDMTTADWTQVPPIDILTGGTPCQDLSHAGKRQGMTQGTRSNLWVAMREAIAVLRPQLVIWENVEGAASAPADSEVEPCTGCVGDKPDVPLRALGRVVGDLSTLGYVGRVGSLRASDVGAPHSRRRRFLAATPADTSGIRRAARRPAATRETTSRRAPADIARRGSNGPLLGTPRASEWKGTGPVGSKSHTHMLERDYLSAQVLTLLPGIVDWGIYKAAIHRWEVVLGRPAPPPTQPSKRGAEQLSPRFSEFLMGLPDGWVTDIPGITRNQALHALGNGVVPQQCETAIRTLLAHTHTEATA